MSRLIVLLVAFLDNLGVGLVFPILPSMMYDSSFALFSVEISETLKGSLLGLLLAVMPLFQFLTAPIFGTLSDGKGRKKPLLASILLAILGYSLSLIAVGARSFSLLLISRIIVGAAAGNISIVQAVIADISTQENKVSNFGLYSMVLGVGFALGPFFGGALASLGYIVPFIFALALTLLSFLLTLFFQETHFILVSKKMSFSLGFSYFLKAFQTKGLRTLFTACFLHNFGWSFFFGLSSVYFISHYLFSPFQLSLFYATVGAVYALSAGIFIRPLTKRIKPRILLYFGVFFTGISIMAIPLLPTVIWLWPTVVLLTYFVSFVAPTYTTLISNQSPPELQGETLGILASVNALALVVSLLFSGSLVGAYPTSPFWVGGLCNICTALLIFFARKI